MYRIGQGYDAHRLVVGRPLWIGGVEIPFSCGLAGHSDADVLIHAVADALLGAAGKGDLGAHFPDSDAAHAGRPSREFLIEIYKLLDASEFRVVNVDATVTLAQHLTTPVIASGGVSSLDDLRELKPTEEFGIVGAIVGRALYDGRVTVPDAIRILKGE